MVENSDIHKEQSNSRARDHLANERTFLAWIRTSIGMMAFGFVIEKFALFMKEMTVVLRNSNSSLHLHRSPSTEEYSSLFGIILVASGVIISLLAFIKYKKIEKQIEMNLYRPSTFLDMMLVLSVVLTGIFLVIYLSNRL